MKKAVIILALLITNVLFCQGIQKTIDQKLVGCWRGSEIDQQQKGMRKYWVACRLEDGKSILLFVMIDKKGNVTQTTENGKWWTENDKFYELHDIDGGIDVYDYEIIDDSVKFTGVNVLGDANTKYSFFDYKIEED